MKKAITSRTNTMKIALFALLFIGNVFTAFGAGNKEITFRPVTIYVFDEQTKEPLEGVKVKVSNVIYYERVQRLFGIPIHSEVRETFYPIEEFETNEEGMAIIPEYIYKVQNRYYIRMQSFYINIENFREDRRNKPDAYWAVGLYEENQNYYRLINDYKAVCIRSWPNPPFIEPIKQVERTKPYLMQIDNFHSYPPGTYGPRIDFNIDHEEFRIYLERFIEPEEK